MYQKKTLPDPHDVVDQEHAKNLAVSTHAPNIERQAQNSRYQANLAKRACRDAFNGIRGESKKLTRAITEEKNRLKQVATLKKDTLRFGKSKKEGEREPANQFVWVQVGVLLVFMVIIIASGTVSISSVMEDQPSFSGSLMKRLTVAIGFFLMPSVGLTIPFYLIKRRQRLSKGYLILLVVGGVGFGSIFALTWAHTYAVDTDNDLLQQITSIGLAGTDDTSTEEWWLFANASWLTLLMQILADVCFSAAAKCHLSWLSWNYDLFRQQARSESPEWTLLDQEERTLQGTVRDLEAHLTELQEGLEELEDQETEFVAEVCEVANAIFLRETDKQDARSRRMTDILTEVEEKERALMEARQKRDQFLEGNPGVQRQPRNRGSGPLDDTVPVSPAVSTN